MKILVTAPQPFYEERGTPIAVRWVAEGLAAMGHDVDLLTYAMGQDVALSGIVHVRPCGPRFQKVPIGFSFKKLICDVGFFFTFVRLAFRNHYDVVHAGEESVFMALLLKPFLRFRLVYDMDSSMADQILEKWSFLEPIRGFLEWWENRAARKSDLVLPVCDYLARKVHQAAPDAIVEVLHDVAMEQELSDDAEDLRERVGQDAVLALYVGNMEGYQGVGMLIESVRKLKEPGALQVVLIGGHAQDVEACRKQVEQLGLQDMIHVLGPRPVAHLRSYLEQADILFSPRIKGVNTPMKIYSYMLAGKAILATAIDSHTQVLSDECACLVEANPGRYAEGLQTLLNDPEKRNELGRAARQRALSQFTKTQYRETLSRAYRRMVEDKTV